MASGGQLLGDSEASAELLLHELRKLQSEAKVMLVLIISRARALLMNEWFQVRPIIVTSRFYFVFIGATELKASRRLGDHGFK